MSEKGNKRAASRGNPNWRKGVSGNPHGRPKMAEEVRELARAACPEAIARLITLLGHEDPEVVIKAADRLLDRGVGKPLQSVEHTGKDGGPITHEVIERARQWFATQRDELGLPPIEERH